MKEFFRPPGDFLQKFCAQTQREHAQAAEGHRRIHPEVPQRAQRRAAEAEIEHAAQKRSQQEIEPQLPVAGGEGVADDAGGHGGAEQQVAGDQQGRDAPAHGTQQVVGQSQSGAQGCRAAQQAHLLGDVDLHGQPNRREKKPPPRAGSSS